MASTTDVTLTTEPVVVERRAGALWLRLNRADTLNAFSPDIAQGLMEGLDEALDDDVRCVVITGTGRAFCAGADLKALRAFMEAELPAEGRGLHPHQAYLRTVGLPVFDRLVAFPKPVIAAVQGLALGGGLELVLCCDFVLAARSARFGDAHANYGLLPGGGGSVRLPRRVGVNLAKYLMFTGEIVPAARLADTDLLLEVTPDEELVAAVDRLTERLADKSPLGLRRMKELVDAGMDMPVAVGVHAELQVNEAHALSDDFSEGLRAFEQKRAPDFSGS